MQQSHTSAPLHHRTSTQLVLIGLVCAAAAAAIWIGPGLINTRGGGDSPFLLIRTYELAANLRAGIFPARWMPDAAYGLGYPFFNYYASLPYYLAAGLNALGVDLLFSIKFTQTVGMFAAGYAMYLLVWRGGFSQRPSAKASPPATQEYRWPATLAACAYVLAPFHLVNIYVRGDSLSEFWAFVWYPLILWGVSVVTQDAGRSYILRLASCVFLSVCLAALVLTHNVSAVLFAPFIVIFALAQLLRSPAPVHLRSLLLLALSALLALALSAWFWLPALGEASLAQLGDQTTGYFNYANHFRSPNLVQSSLLVNYFVNQSGDAFAMGLVQTAFITLGTVVWSIACVHAQASRFSLALMVVLFALTTFMLTPLSAFIWEHAPLLKLAQFPWRMLSVQAMFGAVLIGGLATWSVGSGEWRPRVICIACCLILTSTSLWQLPNERLNIISSDVTPRTIQLYEWYTGNIGTTIRAEYLPITAQPHPHVGPDLLGLPRQALVAQEGVPPEAVSSELVSRTPYQQVWQITTTQDVSLTLPMIHSPAWQAQLDGMALTTTPNPGSGWVTVRVPQGEHRIELFYAGTPLQTLSNVVSVIALLAALGLVAICIMRLSAPLRLYIIGLAMFTLLALVGVRLLSSVLPQTATPPSLQAIDFQSRPFPHRGPVVFEGNDQSYELIGATMTPENVKAGDPFTLTLQWRDGRSPPTLEVTQETPMGGEFTDLFRSARQVTVQSSDSTTHTALAALPGPQLIKLTAKDKNGDALLQARDVNSNPLTTLIGGKWKPGITLIGPTVVAANTQLITKNKTLTTFENGIALTEIDWFFASENSVCLRPKWTRSRRDVNRADSLQVSMRLRGSDDRLIAQADSQPQAGLAPTWSWPDGAVVADSQCVPTLPSVKLLNANEAYTLQIVWYRLANLQQTGEATLQGTRTAGLNDLNMPVPK